MQCSSSLLGSGVQYSCVPPAFASTLQPVEACWTSTTHPITVQQSTVLHTLLPRAAGGCAQEAQLRQGEGEWAPDSPTARGWIGGKLLAMQLEKAARQVSNLP